MRSKNFEEKVKFENELFSIDYTLPSKLVCPHCEAIAFFEPCFKNLNFYEFYFILISILEEKYVFFISENFQLLTSTM